MTDVLLVLNAGSSSIKYGLYPVAEGPAVKRGQIDRIGQRPTHRSQNESTVLPVMADTGHVAVLRWLGNHLQSTTPGLNIVGSGHRVVHGGRDYTRPIRLTPKDITILEGLSSLAPAHQPHNLAGIAAADALWPGQPRIACFDTAFHRSQPRLSQLYAIPRALTDEGLLRYGFHGLSYDFIASQLPEVLGARANGRVVVLHLGNGASMCAMKNRQSVATSMGFTALDGLMMGRRCGDIDPGVVFYLMREKGLTLDETENLLSEKSGLLGTSGISSDMRDLLASDAPEAAEAVALFNYRACGFLGSMAAALGGLDAIVFTGGIGEHAAQVRAGILNGSAWLGTTLDVDANAEHGTTISTVDARVSAHVIATNEERVIATHTRKVLASPSC